MKVISTIVLIFGSVMAITIIFANAKEVRSPYPPPEEKTCNAPIKSSTLGKCMPPQDGIECIQCYDQCTSDAQCKSAPNLKCCPTKGCGNNCSDLYYPARLLE